MSEASESEARALRTAALVVATALHVESTMPDVFPSATVDRLEKTVHELMQAAEVVEAEGAHVELGYETRETLARIVVSLHVMRSDTTWGRALMRALQEALGQRP